MPVQSEIEVNVPVGTAYNQWTQFEDFPLFMEDVHEVNQSQQTDLEWSTDLGGRHAKWRARVMRQVPDKTLAWVSKDAAGASGTVVFKPVSPERTRIRMRVRQSEAATALAQRIDGYLRRFKALIEERRIETGAWRGEIIHGRVRHVAPIMDSVPAPDADEIRFGVSPLQ